MKPWNPVAWLKAWDRAVQGTLFSFLVLEQLFSKGAAVLAHEGLLAGSWGMIQQQKGGFTNTRVIHR